jgi:hypothetical protein
MEEDQISKDLYKSLLTSKDSLPGPDSIPYSVYKKYWKTAGPIILKAWKYSNEMGKLPSSHL